MIESIVILAVLVVLVLTYRLIQSGPEVWEWFKAYWREFSHIFVRHQSLLDDENKNARSGPDMAFSAGRDAAHEQGRATEVHLPMPPEYEAQMRIFYFDLMGLTEGRKPNHLPDQDGFWGILGARRAYFGMSPNFEVRAGVLPSFTVRNLDAKAAELVEAGHQIEWDERRKYARRLLTIDPAGNTIAIIRG